MQLQRQNVYQKPQDFQIINYHFIMKCMALYTYKGLPQQSPLTNMMTLEMLEGCPKSTAHQGSGSFGALRKQFSTLLA